MVSLSTALYFQIDAATIRRYGIQNGWPHQAPTIWSAIELTEFISRQKNPLVSLFHIKGFTHSILLSDILRSSCNQRCGVVAQAREKSLG